MNQNLTRLLAAIRAQPWAIMPEYLDAIEAVAARAYQSASLSAVAQDGHQDRLAASMQAVAAVGSRLEGTVMSTVRDGTAVVPILGPIYPRASMVSDSAGGSALATIMRDFRVAESDASVDRGVFLVDSPGGVVSGLSEAAQHIRGASKPWTVFVTGTCASAAYWLGSQASRIVMDASAQVGCLGVMMSMRRQVQASSDGTLEYTFTSSGSPLKRPDPETEDGRAAIQAMVDAAEAVFFADVATGRRVSVATVRNEYGRGTMLGARAAVDQGMADAIGTLESVLVRTPQRGANQGAGSRRARASATTEMRRRAAQ